MRKGMSRQCHNIAIVHCMGYAHCFDDVQLRVHKLRLPTLYDTTIAPFGFCAGSYNMPHDTILTVRKTYLTTLLPYVCKLDQSFNDTHPRQCTESHYYFVQALVTTKLPFLGPCAIIH